MKPSVESMIKIARGFENCREQLDAERVRRIRESDIVRQAPAFESAFESAKFLGFKKPASGLGFLGQLIAKMEK